MTTFAPSPTASTAADPAAIAELEYVCFSYGVERVLDEVTMRVARGDFLGIIGPNGSGKTTLLRILLGLLPPESGHVRLFGTDIWEFRDWHRIGYVPQKAVAFESKFPASVLEVVMSGRCGRAGLGRRFDVRDRQATLGALGAAGLAGDPGARASARPPSPRPLPDTPQSGLTPRALPPGVMMGTSAPAIGVFLVLRRLS